MSRFVLKICSSQPYFFSVLILAEKTQIENCWVLNFQGSTWKLLRFTLNEHALVFRLISIKAIESFDIYGFQGTNANEVSSSSDYPCWLYFYAIVAKSKARRGYNKYVCKDSSLRDKQRIQKQSVSSSLLNSIWVRNTRVQLVKGPGVARGLSAGRPASTYRSKK